MISLQDCIGLCGLTKSEVLAIAEHEHVTEIVAAVLASSLLKREDGVDGVRHIIVEDTGSARERGDLHHAHELLVCLKNFLEEHQSRHKRR